MTDNAELPKSVRSLEQRLKSATDSAEGWTQRRRVMAAVILGQMLPPAAIKGGTAMKLRTRVAQFHWHFGRVTKQTKSARCTN